MSGRSAHVRKKNDRKSAIPRGSSVSGVQIVPASVPRTESVENIHGFHGSSSPGSIQPGYFEYGPGKAYYPHQAYSPDLYGPPRQRQPVVVASAIEKSDFRAQVDGLSDNFRGKLGRMFGGGKGSQKGKSAAQPPTSWDGVPTDDLAPAVHEVPSLIHSSSTDEQARSLPPNFPFHSSRSKPSSTRHGAYSHQESSLSLPSQGQPEFSLFGGHRENRGRKAWKNVSRSPENLATSVDTLVKLFAPSQTTRALAAFHIDSHVLRDAGHNKWLGMLGDYTPLLGDIPDNATVSSGVSNPEYSTDAGTSEHPRSVRPQNIKFELVLDCPDDGLDVDPMSWVMTTRNYFAILHDHDVLCGRTLFEAISNLMTRLNENGDYLPPNKNGKAFILEYLVRHRFLDVRNNPGYALSLLAFSQQPAIQWKEAAIETFVHCAGMRLFGTLNHVEAQHLSPYTTILITNMSNELKQRLHRVQKHFATFDLSEMWPSRISTKSAGRLAFDRFRNWLTQYLYRMDPTLHESMSRSEIWLTHERIQRYKKIFHSLFDYLVNRDVEFDGSEYEPGNRWHIVSKVGVYFKADPTADLPMTEILNDFDNAKGYPHLPAPYPLVPESQPPKSKTNGKKAAHDGDDIDLRSASYTDASNLILLGTDSSMDPIISEFVNFEQTDEIQSVDPRDARLGRWVLIYGALQLLASIETTTPGVRYKDGVRYCMSCKVGGALPWVKEREGELQEARSPSHQMAYPFTVPSTWPATIPKPRTTSYKTIQFGEYGDGRKRPEEPRNSPSRAGDAGDRPSTAQSSATLTRSSSGVKKALGAARAGGRGGLADVRVDRERSEAEKARERREKAFGFTDYKPEAGW